MNDLLRDCRDLAQVYIDDIVIHSASLKYHVAHIKKVLTLLRSDKLYAKRKKCIFGAQEIDFCGFLVVRNGIRSQLDKLNVIK